MHRWKVYILESCLDGTKYKGFTKNIQRRLEQHNKGESRYTRRKAPWKLIYIESCESKTEAIKREKQLKRANSQYLNWLIHESNRNKSEYWSGSSPDHKDRDDQIDREC